MRFSINCTTLREGLETVQSAVPPRTTLPVLSNILFEARGESILLRGTDLDTYVSFEAPAVVREEGVCALPARKMLEISKALPGGEILIEGPGTEMKIEAGESRFRLQGVYPDDFPSPPKVRFDSSWRIPAKLFRKLVDRTAFAASTEKSRPILNGVLWEVGEGQMRMVATNGHRLTRATAKIEGVPVRSKESFIISPKTLKQIQAMFRTGEIEVARAENHLAFRAEGRELHTRLTDGPYPDYQRVIPQDDNKRVVLDKWALEGAVRRMAIVASENTHRVNLAFGEREVELSVQTPDVGSGKDLVPVLKYSGEALEIGFNATYVLEALRHMPGEEVRVTFKGPERAASFFPNEDTFSDKEKKDEKDQDYLCLVMPLRLME